MHELSFLFLYIWLPGLESRTSLQGLLDGSNRSHIAQKTFVNFWGLAEA